MRVLIVITLFVCELLASPNWYHSIINHNVNSYIGYGDGRTEAEAKQNALTDIAGQIYTKIDSETIQNKKMLNGEYKNDFETKSNQITKANLSDFNVLKVEHQDGKYFAAISYENISNITRFIRKLNTNNSIKNTPIKTSQTQIKPNLLSESILWSSIFQALGTKIDFELIRQNKAWFLRYDDVTQYIDSNDFSKFFGSMQNDKLSISINKKNDTLYDGDEFLFNVKSQDDGFVTIFSVYEDGTVSTLLKNIKIQKDKTTILPDEKYTSIPVAGILEQGSSTFDMYVLVWSDKKLSLDRFADASNETIEDEKYKNLGELSEFIKNKRFTTIKIVTKPRK